MTNAILIACISAGLLAVSIRVVQRLQWSYMSVGFLTLNTGLLLYVISTAFGWSAPFEYRTMLFRISHASAVGLLLTGAWRFAAGMVRSVADIRTRPWFLLCQLIFVAIGAASMGPHVVSGIDSSGSPIYGPLRTVLTLVSIGGVVGVVCLFGWGYLAAKRNEDTYLEFEIGFSGAIIAAGGAPLLVVNVVLPEMLYEWGLASFMPTLVSILWISSESLFLTRGVSLLYAYNSLRLKSAVAQAGGERSVGLNVSKSDQAALTTLRTMRSLLEGREEVDPQHVRIGRVAFQLSPIGSLSRMPRPFQVEYQKLALREAELFSDLEDCRKTCFQLARSLTQNTQLALDLPPSENTKEAKHESRLRRDIIGEVGPNLTFADLELVIRRIQTR